MAPKKSQKKLFDLRVYGGLDCGVLRKAYDYFYDDYLARLTDQSVPEVRDFLLRSRAIWSSDEYVEFETRSYPIYSDMYRHTYLRVNDSVEIHPGLPERVTWRNYYMNEERVGRDRREGVRVMCVECADRYCAGLYTRMRYFNLAVNNCDTMTGASRQTLVTWLFCSLIIVGGLVNLAIGLIALIAFCAVLVSVKIRNTRSANCSSSMRPRYREPWFWHCPHYCVVTSEARRRYTSAPRVSYNSSDPPAPFARN